MTSLLQSRMERRMIDRCTITRDAEGGDDDTFDPVTGTLTRPNPDAITIYTGRCLIYPRTTTQQAASPGQSATVVQDYVLAIPLAETGPRRGDVLTVDSSLDPWLIARHFRLAAPLGGTYAVTRDFPLEEWS